MNNLQVNGHNVDLNDEGFLVDAGQWTPEVAATLAREVGIEPLTDRHWKVITFCREDAARQGQGPASQDISTTQRLATIHDFLPKYLAFRTCARGYQSAANSFGREPVAATGRVTAPRRSLAGPAPRASRRPAC